ncbi:dockerin type I domain-containing protein [Paenibacillus oryzisoli]|uniref:dockerin type I domain-containing protein n=1 Tax=Paenibacillus oryzisoli TaxID=1850517 RepID=UPI003D2C0AAE
MKKSWITRFGLPAVMALMIALFLLQGLPASAVSWSFVDGDGTDGLNIDATKNAIYPRLIDFDGTLFAVWTESNGSANQIRAKKYENGAWVTADNNAPMNKDASKNASNPYLVIFDNTLYASWEEQEAPYWQARVAKFNGTSWDLVDGDGARGLNALVNTNAKNTNLIVYDNSLYLFWDEAGGNGINQLRGAKYGGGSSWTPLNGGSALNKNTTQSAQMPSAMVYGNKLYLAWQESDGSVTQIRVKSFDGTNWVPVDGNGSTGLNINTAKTASTPNLALYNGNLYLAWKESNNNSKDQIRVKMYNGASWTPADGDDPVNGINNSSTASAYMVRMIEFDGDLYATWHEGNVYQIRVKKYDGVSWTSADSGGAKGLNKSATANATFGSLVEYNDSLYAIFVENNGVNQVRVVQLGPSNYKPTVTDVSFSGMLKTGHTLTGTYQYADTESDPEGVTTFQWYTATDAAGTGKTAISGATTTTLNLTSAEVGKYIIFEVTPVATAGTLTGTPATYTSTSAVLANAAPTAASVSITGTVKEGHTLTGTYQYADTESDPEGVTTFQWYTATDAAGTGKTAISGATTTTLNLTSAEADKYIIFEVTPVATVGTLTGTPAAHTSASAVLANEAPTAASVTITGVLMLNQTLTGSYSYVDTDGDDEASTTFQWYTADDAVGTNKTAISGATSKTLTLKAEQYGKFILFEVTPAAASGHTPGIAAGSSAYGVVGVLKGDANGDGVITPADALYVTRYTQGKLTLTDEQLKALDMDGDNDVDADDAQLILGIYLGKGV